MFLELYELFQQIKPDEGLQEPPDLQSISQVQVTTWARDSHVKW